MGLGYMPKGGARAALAHNQAVEARQAAPVAPTRPAAEQQPETASERTDVRGSARSAGRWTHRMLPVVERIGVPVVASVVTTGLLDWVLR